MSLEDELLANITKLSNRELAFTGAYFRLQNITIIHRIGMLNVNDQIVLVITTSKHCQEAFDSCNFIIDYLKTDAPFWKKELSENNEGWVEERVSDKKQKKRWKT